MQDCFHLERGESVGPRICTPPPRNPLVGIPLLATGRVKALGLKVSGSAQYSFMKWCALEIPRRTILFEVNPHNVCIVGTRLGMVGSGGTIRSVSLMTHSKVSSSAISSKLKGVTDRA